MDQYCTKIILLNTLHRMGLKLKKKVIDYVDSLKVVLIYSVVQT